MPNPPRRSWVSSHQTRVAGVASRETYASRSPTPLFPKDQSLREPPRKTRNPGEGDRPKRRDRLRRGFPGASLACHGGQAGLAFQQGSALPPERVAALVPARRAGRPEEVAELVGFLASDRAAYISGQCISINGGMA